MLGRDFCCGSRRPRDRKTQRRARRLFLPDVISGFRDFDRTPLFPGRFAIRVVH